MAKIATQITIGDYAKWRAGFDKAAPFREKAGMKNVQIYRDVDNPTAALIWSEVDDLAKARAILDRPELRNAMREAGRRSKNSRDPIASPSPCPLLALSRHGLMHCTCPLSGVKRTCLYALHMSAFDPK